MSDLPGIPAFEREPYRRQLEVEILEAGEEGGRPFVRLSDTLLYPEGGGQPADRGSLGGVAVLDVQRVEGEIRHYLAEPVTVGTAELELDWEHRFDHMQQHTGQHLLSALAEDRRGWRTTSFHLGEQLCDVELEVPEITPGERASLEEAVLSEVRAARPVAARRVGPAELAHLEVRSRGLPPGHRGTVRLVEIAGIDCTTCGGTHLASTAEIETVKLLGSEAMRGGTRLYWLAGGRVRRRLDQHESRNAELRRLLETSDVELVEVLGTKLDQLQGVNRRRRQLEGQLAVVAAEGLAAQPGGLVEAHFEELGSGFLRQVAQRFSRSAHRGLALLTAVEGGQAFFVLVAGGGSERDVQRLGSGVAELLAGRGGGSGRIFQGRAGAGSLAARPAVLAQLREA